MAEDLKALVQRMIDAGESEDNIGTVIQHFQSQGRRDGLPTDPAEREAIRQQNMATQAGVGAEPTPIADALGTIPGSIGNLAVGAAKGFGKGLLAAVDPRTYIGAAGAAADLMVPTMPGAEERTRGRISGMVRGVTDAFGNPEKTGDLIGQTTAGFVLPRIIAKTPNALVRTGEAMESAATSPLVQRAVHPAAAAAAGATGFGHGSVVSGLAAGAAVEAAPWAMAKTGQGIARTGRKLGATVGRNAGGSLVGAPQTLEEMLDEARGLQPTPPVAESVELPPQPRLTATGRPGITPDMQQAMSVNPHMKQPGTFAGQPESTYAPTPEPVAPNPNAGGRLGRWRPRPSAEQSLADVVQEANVPAPPPVSVEPPPVNPLERAGRSMSGEEIAALQRRPGASPAPADMPVEAPVAEPVAAPAELPPAENISLIREQLEASLKKAGLKSSDVPNPSRSRGGSGRGSGPSATKGYSRADLESIGLDPDTPLTRPLTERETAIVNAARQIRHEQHYGAAVSDAAAKRAVQRGRP